MLKKPELLAPAGSREALFAAINNGADAIYFGLDSFNARMRAENFTLDNLDEVLIMTNALGVKSYITLNTRLFDDELDKAIEIAASAWEKGTSAFIIADMGLATELKRQIPDIEIHASTQLSGHSIADATVLKDAGFSRMVCQREITKSDLIKLVKESPIETEMFIHGAYCMSFSGQCLMSAMLGGRSGNRGECAQPCRQPYSNHGKKCYPLSLKDMCLASHITELINMGVHSLKIEGRQKQASYVGGVTKIYRTLLDENRDATKEEIQDLYRLFNREGFSDGYYTKNHTEMTGIRLAEDYIPANKKPETKLLRKKKADIILYAKRNEKCYLVMKTDSREVTVTGEILNGDFSPLTYEGALKNVSRLGQTPFELGNFEFITDNDAPLALSAVNALRREACEKILSCNREKCNISKVQFQKEKYKGELKFTAEFLNKNQITPLAKDFFERIYLVDGTDSEYGILKLPYSPETDNKEYSKGTSDTYLVHSASQLKAVSKNAKAGLSFRANVFNSKAAEYYASLGAEYLTVAPEVRLAKVRDMKLNIPLSAVIYGRLPLMLMVRCMISNGKLNCKRKDSEICHHNLEDRFNTKFPVFGLPDCTNVIYNSVPVYMADKMDEIEKSGITIGHFIFTNETPEEVDYIINCYKNGDKYKSKEIRRLTF